jgi:hypothetical protein
VALVTGMDVETPSVFGYGWALVSAVKSGKCGDVSALESEHASNHRMTEVCT